MRRALAGFSVSPLMLPYMAVALALGQARVVAGMLCAVLVHELAHAAAARALSLEVYALRLTPFGAAAEIEDLEDAAGAEAVVALAGPAASLGLAMLVVFTHRYLPFPEDILRDLTQWNLTLFLFNMLPGLPLDGGRVVRAMLLRGMGVRRATVAVSWAGVAIGVLLMAAAVLGAMLGALNLTLIAAGLFIVGSAISSLRGAGLAAARGAARKRARGRVLGVKHMAAHRDATAASIAAKAGGRAYCVVTVLDDELRPVGTLGEDALRLAGGATLGELLRARGDSSS